MNITEMKQYFNTEFKPQIQLNYSPDVRQTVMGEVWDGLVRSHYKAGKENVKYFKNPYTGKRTELEIE